MTISTFRDRISPPRSSTSASQRLALLVALCIASAVFGAGALSAQVKVAVIDVQKILLDSTRGKEVQQALEAAQKEKRDQLQALARELEELRKEYGEKALTLADDRLEDLRKQIEDKTLDLKRKQDDAGLELQQLSEKRLQEIENEVMPIIDQVGKEGGYTLVFNKFQSGLVFADEAVDITQSVIDRYNSGGN